VFVFGCGSVGRGVGGCGCVWLFDCVWVGSVCVYLCVGAGLS